jgi:hypothetical protein
MSFIRSFPSRSPAVGTDSDTDNEGPVGVIRLKGAPQPPMSMPMGMSSNALNAADIRSLAGGLLSRLEGGGSGAGPLGNMKVLGCRGNAPLFNRKPQRAYPSCAILDCPVSFIPSALILLRIQR